MSTRSLRARVTATALALLAVALAAVAAFVWTSVRAQQDDELRGRLTDRAAIARQLAPQLTAQQLADRLTLGGTRVTVVTAGGTTVRGVPPAPPAPGGGAGVRPSPPPAEPELAPGAAAAAAAAADVTADGDAVRLTTALPGGIRLALEADRSDQQRALARLLALELTGSLIALGLCGLALWRLLGRALKPLDDLTALALRTAREDAQERVGGGSERTELGRLRLAFDEMLDAQRLGLAQAQASEARMRRFLADASHELRTPLTGVQATAETLLRDGTDRARREELAVGIVRESRRAGRLVDELLRSAREDHAERVGAGSADLAALARDAATLRHPRDHELALQLDLPERCAVGGDGDQLAQVVGGLLDNARRHAHGTVRVGVAGGEGAPAVLTVEDDGTGVPEEERERVFERFVRLDPGRARDAGGSGLGLAIARAAAEAHGGRLRCERSVALGGAAFVLELAG